MIDDVRRVAGTRSLRDVFRDHPVKRFVLDTSAYIADRDGAKAEEPAAFHAAGLPMTYLHAVVVQELLLGAVDARRVRPAPLPSPPHVRLFSDVTNPQPSLSPTSQNPAERDPELVWSSHAMAASSLTAAAALGMLVGLGRRHYTMWQPLNAAAHPIIGERADNVLGFQANVTLPGVAVVLVVSVMAGLIATALTSSRRTFHCAMTAFGVALAGYVVHVNIVARTPGGLATLLQVGELRAVYAAGAIALFAGMRYALSLDVAPSPTH